MKHLVILAAGQGSRLFGAEAQIPKSLVSVLGKPYLEWQLDSFRKLCSDFQKWIVGGFAFEVMQDFLKNSDLASGFHLVLNPDYQKGNLLTLMCIAPSLQEGDFWLFNADHYYSFSTYQKILSLQSESITAFFDTDRNLSDDDMKICRNDQNQLVKISKTLSTWDAGYVGVTHVPKSQAKLYWQAVEQVRNEMGDKANVEAVLAKLAETLSVECVDISGSWWTEIDNPTDLENAIQIFKNKGNQACDSF